jgi:hypothetical protein
MIYITIFDQSNQAYWLFFSQRKFRILVEGEISTPRDTQAGVQQGSVLSPTLYSLYINDTPQTSGVYLGFFADDTCIYATDREEVYVLRKLQRGLTAIEIRCERWNIKINKIRLRQFTFLIELGPLGLIIH